MRILVVEDNRTLAAGLVAVLRDDGFAVDLVHDGPSALAALTAEAFDLDVLDLILTELDALEVQPESGRKCSTKSCLCSTWNAFEQHVTGCEQCHQHLVYNSRLSNHNVAENTLDAVTKFPNTHSQVGQVQRVHKCSTSMV